MKKFLILVKKEIQELLTPQMLVPLVIVVFVFAFLGKIMNKEAAKSEAIKPVAVVDMDKKPISKLVLDTLSENKFTVNLYENNNINDVIKQAGDKKEKAVLLIPQGFGQSVSDLAPKKIEVYDIFRNFSLTGTKDSQGIRVALAIANEKLSSQLMVRKIEQKDLAAIKQPLQTNDFVVIGGRLANINSAVIVGFINSQTTIIPIILFLVIVFASQLIAVSIAAEKENKTLETLLSSPISRKAVVAAKLVAAGLVSLFTAAIYMVGMRNFMSGMAGAGASSATDTATQAAIAQLGLNFSTGDYILLGISLFFGILAALAVAIILGSLAEDTKSAQGVIAPLMVLIIVPYLLTMFLDISALSSWLKILVYAIPFSHPFLAAPNILLHQTQNVWYGIAYLAFFFVLFVFIAAKIFSSDKIFTMKLNFRKKRI